MRWAVDAALASGLRPVVTVVGARSGPIQAALPQGVDVVRALAGEGGDRAEPAGARAARSTGGRRSARCASDSATSPASARRPTGDWPTRTMPARRSPSRPTRVGGTTPCSSRARSGRACSELRGDVGARALMDETTVTEVDCTDTGSPADIDTPADLERMAREMEI